MATSKPGKKQSTDSVRKTKPTKKQIAEVIEKTKTKAEEFARDPIKAKKLLEDAVKKMKGYESNRGPLAEVWGYLTAFFRLLRAYIRKDYHDIAWILYFVSPLDLIPDILPGGLIDDAAVIAFVVAQTKIDLDNFLAWEVERLHSEDDTESSQNQPA